MNHEIVTSGRMEESEIPDISEFASGISYANRMDEHQNEILSFVLQKSCSIKG